MIRALLDTNIVLDALADREPFSQQARKIFLLAEAGKFNGFLSANTITDIYYVSRKQMPEDKVREHLANLMKLFKVLPIEEIDCKIALKSNIKDYEDALLASISDKYQIKYIITRDDEFIKECDLTISPSKFIAYF